MSDKKKNNKNNDSYDGDKGRLRMCDLHSAADAVDAFGEDKGLLVCRIKKSSSPCSFANVSTREHYPPT